MRLYVAGSWSKEWETHIKNAGVYKLYSIMQEKTQISKWPSNTPLIIDSGAHSWNKTTIKAIGGAAKKNLPNIYDHLNNYTEFMKRFIDREQWVFVELDCYAVLPKSVIDEHYRTIRNLTGRKFEFMRVYHPCIDNGSLEELKAWIDDGQKYIGLGLDALPLFGEIFKITRDKVKLHGFACTSNKILDKYPFFSVDSTTPLSPARFGGHYTKGKVIHKAQLIKNKSLPCVFSTITKMKLAIDDIIKQQEYYTKLWKERGVVWER